MKFVGSVFPVLLFFALIQSPACLAETHPIKLEITRAVAVEGNAKWDWWQARTAYVPGPEPYFVTTMSETGKTGTHDFHDIYQTISRDGGKSWSKPSEISTLKRVQHDDGYQVAPGDLWPMWHAKSSQVLTTGKTFNFANGRRENYLRESVSYAVMDPKTRRWNPMRRMQMPTKDHSENLIIAPNAGCTQRVDLPDGDVLLPVRYQRDAKSRVYTSVVVRCSFDGQELKYKEHGSEHTFPQGRGLYEPSLASFQDQYFLTLRADHSAFVTKGDDGIHFQPVKEWTFDDGESLGSYNTQQHWLTVGGGLFLVYTRRGANNDHIMRHRAPLFIAQVDVDRLQVIRSTEQVLLLENHATLGNSGVCWINENESLITCGEGLVHRGKRRGEHNKVFVVNVKAVAIAKAVEHDDGGN